MNTSTRRTDGLSTHVAVLADFSSALITLTTLLPERITLSQAAFFLLTASADISGQRPTFTEIKDVLGPAVGRSLHSTYRSLLVPSKAVPYGAGLLDRTENFDDNRQKILKLTPKGRELMREVIEALTGKLV